MKNLTKRFYLLSLLVLAGNSLAQEISETTREIMAQTTITRGAIDNIVTNMGRDRAGQQFRATDYHAQAKVLNENIERTLLEFQDELEHGILSRAAALMTEYNGIFKSSAFTQQQKQLLLSQRLSNMKIEFEKISGSYQAALRKVYALVPNYDFKTKQTLSFMGGPLVEACYNDARGFEATVTVETNRSSKKIQVKVPLILNKEYDRSKQREYKYTLSEVLKTGAKAFFEYPDNWEGGLYEKTYQSGTCEVSRDGVVIQSDGSKYVLDLRQLSWIVTDVPTVKKQVYQSMIYRPLKGDCRSAVCVGLRTSDLLDLLQQVRQKLDREIPLKLADGTAMTLNPLNVESKKIIEYMNFTDYPETLPFDL